RRSQAGGRDIAQQRQRDGALLTDPHLCLARCDPGLGLRDVEKGDLQQVFGGQLVVGRRCRSLQGRGGQGTVQLGGLIPFHHGGSAIRTRQRDGLALWYSHAAGGDQRIRR